MSDTSDAKEQEIRGERSENSELRKQLKAQRLRADTAEADLLRTSDALIAAEQRISELIGELRKCAADLSGVGSLLKSFHSEHESQWCGYLDDALGASRFRHAEAIAALNQKSEGGESHGS